MPPKQDDNRLNTPEMWQFLVRYALESDPPQLNMAAAIRASRIPQSTAWAALAKAKKAEGVVTDGNARYYREGEVPDGVEIKASPAKGKKKDGDEGSPVKKDGDDAGGSPVKSGKGKGKASPVKTKGAGAAKRKAGGDDDEDYEDAEGDASPVKKAAKTDADGDGDEVVKPEYEDAQDENLA